MIEKEKNSNECCVQLLEKNLKEYIKMLVGRRIVRALGGTSLRGLKG